MFNAEKYLQKNGCIYGISEKCSFGKWNGYSVKFDNMETAETWLHTEETDFRIRTLCNKTEAKRYREALYND